MSRKYKLTGFARFVIFLVMISPFCYIGSLQYQNNPDIRNFIDNLKSEINLNVEHTSEEAIETMPVKEINTEDIKEEINDLKERIEDLEEEINNQIKQSSTKEA